MKHWSLIALGLASVIAFSPLAAAAIITKGSDSGSVRKKQNFKARDYHRGGETFLYQSSDYFYNRRREALRRNPQNDYFFDSFEYSRPRNTYRNSRRSIFELFDPRPTYRRRSSEGTSTVVRSPDDGFPPYQPHKLIALAAPDLIAPAFSSVIASIVFDELKSGGNPVRVTKAQRDAIVAFYRRNNFAPIWVSPEGLNDKAKRALELMAKAEDEGLDSTDYLPPVLGSFADDGSDAKGDFGQLSRLELAVSAMALRYAKHAYSGRIIPNRLSGYHDIEPPVLDLVAALKEMAARPRPDEYLASLHPQTPDYAKLKAAYAEFEANSASDTDEPIPAGTLVKPGMRDGRVPLVRRRMIKLGFLDPASSTAAPFAQDDGSPAATAVAWEDEDVLDKALSEALKKYQAKNGVKASGMIGPGTIAALNAMADQRSLLKLVLNMERARWLPRNLGGRHIIVNAAAFELRLVENDKTTWRTNVIVGKPETQTAVFSDEMEMVVINPYWRVPGSIIRTEMLPILQEDPSYLDRLGYEVFTSDGRRIRSRSADWWSMGSKVAYNIRQPPGGDNTLGRIKFLFPNEHNIYMHDTPTKKLFKKPMRAYSHGCIRVENPRELGVRVLGFSREEVDALIDSGENQTFNLKRKTPVHISYFTAWPDATGEIAYYADIYGRDARLEKAFSAIAVAAK